MQQCPKFNDVPVALPFTLMDMQCQPHNSLNMRPSVAAIVLLYSFPDKIFDKFQYLSFVCHDIQQAFQPQNIDNFASPLN
jgi:hypothetical protein